MHGPKRSLKRLVQCTDQSNVQIDQQCQYNFVQFDNQKVFHGRLNLQFCNFNDSQDFQKFLYQPQQFPSEKLYLSPLPVLLSVFIISGSTILQFLQLFNVFESTVKISFHHLSYSKLFLAFVISLFLQMSHRILLSSIPEKSHWDVAWGYFKCLLPSEELTSLKHSVFQSINKLLYF